MKKTILLLLLFASLLSFGQQITESRKTEKVCTLKTRELFHSIDFEEIAKRTKNANTVSNNVKNTVDKSLLFLSDTIYVDDDFDESTTGWGVTHFDSIHTGIEAVEGVVELFMFIMVFIKKVFPLISKFS